MLNEWIDSDSKFSTDFLGESHREKVAKLAYEYWQARGCPLGSPDVDWLEAEQALNDYLCASGDCPQPMSE